MPNALSLIPPPLLPFPPAEPLPPSIPFVPELPTAPGVPLPAWPPVIVMPESVRFALPEYEITVLCESPLSTGVIPVLA